MVAEEVEVERVKVVEKAREAKEKEEEKEKVVKVVAKAVVKEREEEAEEGPLSVEEVEAGVAEEGFRHMVSPLCKEQPVIIV